MNPPRRSRIPALALISWLAAAHGVRAEEPPPVDAAASGKAPRWKISGSANGYFLPDENYLLPIVYAARDRLHLEARYNYEERGAGSIFAGWTFEHAGDLQVEFTPMAGIVLGAVEGFAPGFELTLTYGPMEYYAEFEYVFDREDYDASFLYNWSELSYAPVDWFRVGLTTQRTRVYKTERDIQRALLLGGSAGNLTFTAHLFNLDDEDAFYVFAVGADF